MNLARAAESRECGRGVPITRLEARAYTIPTDTPESDGTLEWGCTAIVVAQVNAGNVDGIGYSYTHPAAAAIIGDPLAEVVRGRDPLDVRGCWLGMLRSIRNFGRPGIAASAISAVDAALWDLKARLLGLPLVKLLGQVHERVPIYGSGGFTSYSPGQLRAQLRGWAEAGFTRMKIKVGRDPLQDLNRIRLARETVGDEVELFVDANGAYNPKSALSWAERFAEFDVRWYEEPVSSDDIEGLRLVRYNAPAGMQVAAGEYGYDAFYFRRMLEAGAVDVLQADATRCLGITGFLQAGMLCEASALPLSAHTAPALHLHACCALVPICHLEWFHDHARVERMLFDGVVSPSKGVLQPDLSRPGLGLELRESDADRFRVR